jgi:hypothetical protein
MKKGLLQKAKAVPHQMGTLLAFNMEPVQVPPPMMIHVGLDAMENFKANMEWFKAVYNSFESISMQG